MPRFSLAQYLMGIALLPVLLSFLICEGCGARRVKIGAMVFSPTGASLTVAKYSARGASEPGKAYLAHVGRTISTIKTSDANEVKVKVKDRNSFRTGGSRTFGWVKDCVQYLGEEEMLIVDFGGGAIRRHPEDKTKPTLDLVQPATTFALSSDRQILVAYVEGQVALHDLIDDKHIATVHVRHGGRTGLCTIDHAVDWQLAACVGERQVALVDTQTGNVESLYIDADWVLGVRFVPNSRTLAVATDNGVHIMDFSGQLVRKIARASMPRCITASHDGRFLAIVNFRGQSVDVFEVATGVRVSQCTVAEAATSAVFSPIDYRLAVGDWQGHVTMFDGRAGKVQWSISPPSIHRPPWTMPAMALAAWGLACYWLFIRGKKERRRMRLLNLANSMALFFWRGGGP